MTTLTLHTIETAPDAAKPLLEKAVKDYGMLPGLYQVMASSPELLAAYFELHALFEKTALSAEERTVIWLAINVENQCHYCVPAHTAIAKSEGVDDAIINALRDETPLSDPRLEALRNFTLVLVRNQGNPSKDEIDTFLQAGFEPRTILDILVGLAQKTLSNYTNHIAQTPVDEPFRPFTWEASKSA